jgi:porin
MRSVTFSIACLLFLIASQATGQVADTDSMIQETAAKSDDTGQPLGPQAAQGANAQQGVTVPQPANAQQVEPSRDVPVSERTLQSGTVILPADHFFGDWCGHLPAWEDSGFKPSLNWLTNLAGNPVGGREQGITECEDLGLDLSFDLEKRHGICDTYFHVSTSQRSGTSLTNDYIGNVFSTQQEFGGETFRLVDVDLRRYFCEHAVEVRLGRIVTTEDFMVSPYFWYFMSGGINGNPASVGINAPGLTSYPFATWGARMRVATTRRTYAMVGLYNGDPTIRSNDEHGCDFSLRGPLFAIAEIGYQRNGGAEDEGMLGNYKLGGYYNGGSFSTFSPSQFSAGAPGSPSTVSGNWGYYAMFDQVVFQPYGNSDPRGMGIFASIDVAPDQSINEIPFFCDGGILIRGLVPGRTTDVIGFGVIYGKFSPDLQTAQQLAQVLNPTVPVQEYELVFEWAYKIRMRNGAVFFQPDFQYIVNPGGGHQYPNAFVVGAQMGVNF